VGATGWQYFVPYEEDVESALQKLRRRVFEQREYLKPTVSEPKLNQFIQGLPPEQREEARLGIEVSQLMHQLTQHAAVAGANQSLAPRISSIMQQTMGRNRSPGALAAVKSDLEALLKELQIEGDAESEPATIDELLEARGEPGTHCILDIQHVADKPGFATASPMPEPVMIACYGTTRPTRGQIEGASDSATENLARWQAYYAIVYHGGEPREIYFEGCSGD
jgi:hypothetical protein